MINSQATRDFKKFSIHAFFDENEGKEKKIAVKGKTTNEEGLERWLVHSTIATKESIDGHFDEQEYLISAGRIAKALLLDSYELDKRSLLAPKGKFDFGM